MSRWKDGASALASLMVLILIIAVCSAIFSRITDSEEVPPETYTVASEPALSEAEPVEDSSSFRITFLNVGQGDAALVECDGHAMLVDGGSVVQSGKIYTVLKEKNIRHLDYVAATHPDADHVGGLSVALHYARADNVLVSVQESEEQSFQTFLRTAEQFSRANSRIAEDNDLADSQNSTDKSKAITVVSARDVFSLGSARVEVLGPVALTDSDNDNSLVLRIVHGECSVLLTGDCGFPEEDDILKSFKANLGGSNFPETAEEDQVDAGTTDAILQADILKVAHHGSAHATSEEWLQAVKPSCAVISCGKNNEYGHPATSLMKRLEQMDVQTYRTDLLGDICFWESSHGWEIEPVDHKKEEGGGNSGGNTGESIGGSIEESLGGSIGEGAEESAGRSEEYIVNTRTGIFHRPDCESVGEMADGNKWYFSGEYEELKDMNYVPCGACNPCDR